MARLAATLDATMQARRVDVAPELLAAARRGELRRSNTVPGTPERQAVSRVEYLRRRERHAKRSAREALGHFRPGRALPSATIFVDDPPRRLDDVELSRTDVRRAGRYLSLVGQLTGFNITPETFERRVRHWRPITVLGPAELAGEYRFLAAAEAAIVLDVQARLIDGVEVWINSDPARQTVAPS